MFDLKCDGALTEAACVINYDISNFTHAMLECDADIDNTIRLFQSRIDTALVESVGVMNTDVNIIIESGLDTIKQKLITILKTIKEFIETKLHEIIEAIKNIKAKLKVDLDKIEPIVVKREQAGDYKNGPYADLYFYNTGVMANANSSIMLNDNIDKLLSDDGDAYKEMSAVNMSVHKFELIKAAYKGHAQITLDNYQEVFNKEMRCNKGRVKCGFTSDFFKHVKKGDISTSEYESAMNKLLDNDRKLLNEINHQVVLRDKEGIVGEETDILRYAVQYMSMASSIITQLAMMKLKTVLEEVNEMRQFCIAAYHYKTPKK